MSGSFRAGISQGLQRSGGSRSGYNAVHPPAWGLGDCGRACCLSLYGIRLWCLLAQGNSDRSFPVCWAWPTAGRGCSGTSGRQKAVVFYKDVTVWHERSVLLRGEAGTLPPRLADRKCSVSIRNGLREDPQLFLVVRSPIPYKVYEGAKFMSNLVTVYDGVLSHLQLQPSLRLPSVAQHVLDSVHGNLTVLVWPIPAESVGAAMLLQSCVFHFAHHQQPKSANVFASSLFLARPTY